MKDIVEIKKKTYYGNTAKDYDSKRLNNPYGKNTDYLEKRAINCLLVSIKCKKILDLPCGTGRITKFLLEKNYLVYGVDVSSDMIKEASIKLKKYPNLLGLKVSSGDSLRFKDNEFDCVTSIRLMGHLPKDYRLKVLKEMNRVSDYIIVSYHSRNSIMGLLKRFQIILGLKDKNWFQVSENDAIKELEKCGFKVIGKSYVLRGIAETYFLVGQKDS